MSSKSKSMLYLLLVAGSSLGLSYAYGNEGLEAFYSVYIASGLVLSTYIIKLVHAILTTKYWLFLRLLGSVVVIFFWLIVSVAVLLPILEPNINPSITVRSPNWLIVAVSATAFAVQLPIKVKLSTISTADLFVRILFAFLSIIVLFVAFLVFFSKESAHRPIVLIFAMQSTYIAGHIYSSTDFVANISKKYITDQSSALKARLAVALLGLPFFIPIALMIFL